MFRIVIPARHGSARLPGKPLILIAGKPMLQWVFERAQSFGAADVVVATDDARVADAARRFGAPVAMTRANHESGTDRIAEVVAQRAWPDDAVIVNLQGDEPLMPAELVLQVAQLLSRHAAAEIATLASPLQRREELLDPNVVKVVTDLEGRALYFSRAPIPWAREGAAAGLESQRDFTGARRHIGLYAYRVRALRRLAALAPTQLERLEKLEQLRALEHGMDIRVANACVAPGPDVNTAADLDIVSRELGRVLGELS